MKENEKKIVKSNVHNSDIIFLQGFFSGETNFYFCQFFSNFFKYSFSNFPSSHLYNIFVIYFSGNSLLLESLSFTISNFSYCLTFVFNLPSNSTTTTFIFSKSSSLPQVSCFAVNLFYHTRYFTASFTFLLFSIFSTSYFSNSSTSTSFTSSIFYPSTYSLYCIT